MAKYELLNNVDHKDLRVKIDRSAELGDNVWFTPTFPQEFRTLQKHYPIVFTKNAETGQFQAVALMGFEVGENLFLEYHAATIFDRLSASRKGRCSHQGNGDLGRYGQSAGQHNRR